MYHVTRWDTGDIIDSFSNVRIARRSARSMGHTGEDDPHLTSYPPIAYVANDAGEVVYNPRFGKQISTALSGLINAQNSDSF